MHRSRQRQQTMPSHPFPTRSRNFQDAEEIEKAGNYGIIRMPAGRAISTLILPIIPSDMGFVVNHPSSLAIIITICATISPTVTIRHCRRDFLHIPINNSRFLLVLPLLRQFLLRELQLVLHLLQFPLQRLDVIDCQLDRTRLAVTLLSRGPCQHDARAW